jgi:hypothetical protein
MRRRTVLTGLGASAVGGGALLGTGAFDLVEADRTATITVADEDAALLAMAPSEDPNSAYATQRDQNEIALVFNNEADNGEGTPAGAGLGQNSTYTFDDVFVITNQGTQTVSVGAAVAGIDDHAGVESFVLYDSDDEEQFSEKGEVPEGIVIAPGESISVGVEIETGDETEKGSLSITISTGAAEGQEDDKEETKPASHPESQFPQAVTDPRARRAANAWERGYRGRADRTLALTDSGVEARHGDLGPWNGVRTSNGEGSRDLRIDAGPSSFDDIDLPDANELPELVAWHQDDSANSTNADKPRDENGHGTHVASIMTGTGRTKAFDPTDIADSWQFEADDGTPNRSVGTNETITREFTVPAERDDATLFCAATGEWIGIRLVGPDGTELATDSTAQNAIENTAAPVVWNDSNAERATIEADVAHDAADYEDEDPTYRIEIEQSFFVRVEGETVIPPEQISRFEVREAGVVELVEEGTDLAEEGIVANPEDVDVPGDVIAAGGRSVHPGVAPGYSLIGAAGLSSAMDGLAGSANKYAEEFNLRAVNMSWGNIGGLPTNFVENPIFNDYQSIASLAEAGIATVAAAGNTPGTPATGSHRPAAASEAISTVWTDRLDGIDVLSSGGLGVVDEDGELFLKPDVCAYGNNELAAQTGGDTGSGGYGEESGYTVKSGTSMASPSICGLVGLVTQAMEEDGPAGLEIPKPSAMTNDDVDGREWVLKTKQAILATASTTAFNALPWHGDQTPAYNPGERDPYEGFGRANYGAAIDAVSRDLASGDEDSEKDAGYIKRIETLGLNVPDDEQAAAGYIQGPGKFIISTGFEGYEGGDADLTDGKPHVDLFVYDALNPAGPDSGDPNVVASQLGVENPRNTISVDLEEGDVYYVVAKLVSVPGDATEQIPEDVRENIPNEISGVLFNSLDVQANIELLVDDGS